MEGLEPTILISQFFGSLKLALLIEWYFVYFPAQSFENESSKQFTTSGFGWKTHLDLIDHIRTYIIVHIIFTLIQFFHGNEN